MYIVNQRKGTLTVIYTEVNILCIMWILLWQMSFCILDILFDHLSCLCNTFYGFSALVGCWSSVFIRSIIYKILNVCPVFAVCGTVGILFNHTSWMTVVNLKDRPKSVRNRYLIEVFDGRFLYHLAFWSFLLCIVFFIGLSQISSLFSCYGWIFLSNLYQTIGMNRSNLLSCIYINILHLFV